MAEESAPQAADLREMPNLCPACNREPVVTELVCPACQASIRGRFVLGPLARLPRDMQRFLLLFVRCRGNIREAERELGLSYPTVRARLDQLIAALDSDGQTGDLTAARLAILSRLEKGEIGAAEAAGLIRDITRQIGR